MGELPPPQFCLGVLAHLRLQTDMSTASGAIASVSLHAHHWPPFWSPKNWKLAQVSAHDSRELAPGFWAGTGIPKASDMSDE